MQIRNRLFSYPVYSSSVDDYKVNSFSFDYEVESNEEMLNIKYKANLANKYVLNQLQTNIINLTLLVECAKTAYRNLFVLQDFNGTVSIPASALSAKVELCCLLLANKDFIINSKNGISDDYSNNTFEIKRYKILKEKTWAKNKAQKKKKIGQQTIKAIRRRKKKRILKKKNV